MYYLFPLNKMYIKLSFELRLFDSLFKVSFPVNLGYNRLIQLEIIKSGQIIYSSIVHALKFNYSINKYYCNK